MAKRASIFGDEWRLCLEEHYKYVVRQQDKATEETLVPYLERFGFTEDDLKHLTVIATMRADDMPDDFVPDMQPIQSDDVSQPAATPVDAPEASFITHPAECQCAACMDEVLDAGHDADGQPLDEDALQEEAERARAEAKNDAPSVPKQRSLF